MSRVLGLDLGGTNLKAAFLDPGDSSIEAAGSCPSMGAGGPEMVLETIADFAGRLIGEKGVGSVGLAVPGHFERENGTAILLPNLPGDWAGRPIRAPLEARLGVQVELINDARAMGLAEARVGAGKGVEDLICVTMGTGIGGAVVLGGRLHLGLGHAGEIGHTTAIPDGPLCGCGNRGCLDRVASAAAIAAAAGRDTVDEVARAAADGDALAAAALAEAGTFVGRALADAVVLLWPEMIVVGGGVAGAGELVLEPIRTELSRRAQVAPVEHIAVVPATLGAGAGAIGAAVWASEQMRTRDGLESQRGGSDAR